LSSWPWHHPLDPPPPVIQRTRTIAVVLPPVGGAWVLLDDIIPPGPHAGTTDDNGEVAFQVSDLPVSRLVIEAPGYRPYVVEGLALPPGNVQIRVGVAADPVRPHDLILGPLVPEAPPRPFPPDSGPLTIRGREFFDRAAQVWRWRGATMFLLLERLMHGEDIQPQIDWMIQTGVNVARVFVAGVPWPGHSWLYEHANWPFYLGQFADRLHAGGIRLEATVGTDRCDDINRWAPILQSVYDILDGRGAMCFVEWVNEPWVNGDGLMHATINRRGILSSYGVQFEGNAHYDATLPMLDYGTVHLPRDLDHFARNSKDLKELQDATRKPWIGDEPLGIADYDKTGSGARTTNRMAVAGHFAIAALYGAGCTIHSQFGLEGRCPSASEPLSESLAQMITDIWRFIPAEAQLGEYARAGLHYPLAWRGEHGDDSQLSSQHAYASIMGDTAYCVLPMPRLDYVPEGVNGWKVDAELLPGIVRVTR